MNQNGSTGVKCCNEKIYCLDQLRFTGAFQLPLMAQNKDQLIREADSLYKANIIKTRINGVYIPKDLQEAFTELDRLSPPMLC